MKPFRPLPRGSQTWPDGCGRVVECRTHAAASPTIPRAVQSGPVWWRRRAGLLALASERRNWWRRERRIAAVHPQPRIPVGARRVRIGGLDRSRAGDARRRRLAVLQSDERGRAVHIASPGAAQAQSEGAAISTTEDLLRHDPAALARGTTMALGGTGDARELARKGLDWPCKSSRPAETAQRVKDVLRSNPFIAALATHDVGAASARLGRERDRPALSAADAAGKYLKPGSSSCRARLPAGRGRGLRASRERASLRLHSGTRIRAAARPPKETAAEPWARAAAALGTGGLAAFTHPTAPRGAAVRAHRALGDADAAGCGSPPRSPVADTCRMHVGCARARYRQRVARGGSRQRHRALAGLLDERTRRAKLLE